MFDLLKQIFNQLLRVGALVSSLSPTVRLLFLVGSGALAFFNWLNAIWAALFSRIDAAASPAMLSLGVDVQPLSFLNYVVPLDTLLTLLTAYFAFKGVSALIRIIKSFVPTIA